MSTPSVIILVRGWSVHHTETYGGLPRLLRKMKRRVEHVQLGRYVSFHDEVRLDDLARGFEAAYHRQIRPLLSAGERFACITHATGGPLIRLWWDHYCHAAKKPCPMSHLVMLAPANFGSAVAQLGKGRLSRMKSALLEGVEPGAGVLNWLELGSAEGWDLNARWIREYSDPAALPDPVFLFVLTGQCIDRRLSDHLNSYAGELGSDGVVRVAAANLNAVYVELVQQRAGRARTSKLQAGEPVRAPHTAFALVPGRSHSGEKMGILRSITPDDDDRHPTVRAILRSLECTDRESYATLCRQLEDDAAQVREAERVERYSRFAIPDITYVRDSGTMIVVRVTDNRGFPINDYDFLLTGPRHDPDRLPEGFFVDRQRNSIQRNTLTYYLNHDKMTGSTAVKLRGTRGTTGKVIRQPIPKLESLGLRLTARPAEGFAHYLPAEVKAAVKNVKPYLGRDETTLVHAVLDRVVRQGVFEVVNDLKPRDFRNQVPGDAIG